MARKIPVVPAMLGLACVTLRGSTTDLEEIHMEAGWWGKGRVRRGGGCDGMDGWRVKWTGGDRPSVAAWFPIDAESNHEFLNGQCRYHRSLFVFFCDLSKLCHKCWHVLKSDEHKTLFAPAITVSRSTKEMAKFSNLTMTDFVITRGKSSYPESHSSKLSCLLRALRQHFVHIHDVVLQIDMVISQDRYGVLQRISLIKSCSTYKQSPKSGIAGTG